MSEPERYQLELRDCPSLMAEDAWHRDTPADARLKAALKALGRRFGFRVERCWFIEGTVAADVDGPTQGQPGEDIRRA